MTLLKDEDKWELDWTLDFIENYKALCLKYDLMIATPYGMPEVKITTALNASLNVQCEVLKIQAHRLHADGSRF